MPRVAVCLSGCGHKDGTEIHEATLTLLTLDQAGAEIVCCAPDVAQTTVFDHLNGKCVSGETRNVLVEAARIRGRSRELQRRLYKMRRQRPGLIKNKDFYAAIKAGFFLPPTVYNEMLETLHTGLDRLKDRSFKGPKLVISGLVFDPMEIYGILDGI